jgi:pSer/pThr/pTyr-binding forkhead associated (FHA) protein
MMRLRDSPRQRLGRAADNDIIIDDDYVSRYHCILAMAGDRVAFRDLVPTNPIRIDGKNVRSGVLAINDVALIGKTKVALVRLE